MDLSTEAVKQAEKDLAPKAATGGSESKPSTKKAKLPPPMPTAPASVNVPTPTPTAPAPQPKAAKPEAPKVASAIPPRGTPESKIWHPQKGSYDDYGEIISTPASADETVVTFVSRHKGLRLKIYVRRDDPDGDYMYFPQTVVFMSSMFTTSDPSVIEAMRVHPNFGGTKSEGFSDTLQGAREALYWQGGLPESIVQKFRDEERQYSPIKGHHEE
jgi:hypothetical protein